MMPSLESNHRPYQVTSISYQRKPWRTDCGQRWWLLCQPSPRVIRASQKLLRLSSSVSNRLLPQTCDRELIETVAQAPLFVYAHNLETVPRLYRRVRPGSDYQRSLGVLRTAKACRPDLITKSSLMLGLGETHAELMAVFQDLREHDCEVLTLGQYLKPSVDQLDVFRYVTPGEFAALKEKAESFGFRHVVSGPLVRSSYHAWEVHDSAV